MYSVEGCSIASDIAIRSSVKGVRTILDTSPNGNFSNITAEQIKNVINEEYPNLWGQFKDFMTMFFK